ncbi:glutamate synthase large subunit [Pseudomonadota bacterium]|nr:glutamate synthase large subunit [Pseudomonadota bacterium]
MKKLYSKTLEKDNCGYGLICHRYGNQTREILHKSIRALESMAHRGAVGADGVTGDGAGLLVDINKRFFTKVIKDEKQVTLPDDFAIGMIFSKDNLSEYLDVVTRVLKENKLNLVTIRTVPINSDVLGDQAKQSLPYISQLFISSIEKNLQLEPLLFQAQKDLENIYKNYEEFYVVSLSSETIVYKGLMMPSAIKDFYPDLAREDFKISTCIFHQRFSTNTKPRWHLAQPFRMLAHNGEINAIRGNRNWVKARSTKFKTPILPKLHEFQELVNAEGSDSSALDNMLQILVQGGMNIFRAIRMVVPPAWQNVQIQDPDIRAFHEFNSMHMESWDGPAGIALAVRDFAIGFLDRNGLRPSRYQVEKNGIITIASEAGVNPVPAKNILEKGRLSPGGIIAINKKTGDILKNSEIDSELKANKPYRRWMKENAVYVESTIEQFEGKGLVQMDEQDFLLATRIFSLFLEERVTILKSLGAAAEEPTGSMGDDTALAVLSSQNRQIYDFFRQQFSQVTNPPIDSLREKSVMSLETCYGPELNIFEESADHAKRLVTYSPLLSHKKIQIITSNKYFKVKNLKLEYKSNLTIEEALDKLDKDVVKFIEQGAVIIHLQEVLPKKGSVTLNALLATGMIHQSLIQKNLRSDINLIVSSASARDTHQIACLIAFGATAVYPWLAYQTILDLTKKHELKGNAFENCAKYRKGINKGLLKIISKMGISMISSYRGSQLFEIVGLSDEVVAKCFTNTDSRIGGKTFKNLEQESKSIDLFARSNISDVSVGGLLKYIHGGEYHAYNPDVVKSLQEATKTGDQNKYNNYVKLVNDRKPSMLRDLLTLTSKNSQIKKSRVEPKKFILKRFDSAGMSLGSLSPKAHETLALAMNQMGGRSNSGEGGEAKERYGSNKRSKIKQIASGRFGVTPEYLVNADVLQIKIAQGAKPGEGGQLPGGKVNALIAKLRYSTPGITLISPPPHHDIYSIEDLAQLIFDLKQINPLALVSVKLVAEPGVGTIACGVTKAYADLITISGHDGGTGASPISSIRYAGSPWELGLAETHQALRESGLRGNVRVQVDGGLKTGLDVIKAAILGAESFGFGTGPMIAMGCKYLKICHLNNCATGVATQRNDIIDKHFVGEKDRVINYFNFIADEVRQILSELGVANLEDIIGQTEYLSQLENMDPRFGDLDLSPILYKNSKIKEPFFCSTLRNNPWDEAHLNKKLVKKFESAVLNQTSKKATFTITNRDRSVGSSLSGLIATKYGEAGLKSPLTISFKGSAGQSFGCWNSTGLNLYLTGEANDYLGKGMNGGKIVVQRESAFSKILSHTLIGNTALYGATGGNLFVEGSAGERFAVRNSGANAVIEGAGDHCCEYMTGGNVTILGSVGHNFGAGMTGGFAYVLDEDRTFFDKCNRELINLDRIMDETMEPYRQHLKEIIKEHFKETKSIKAKKIIENFEDFQANFWLVSPVALSVNELLKVTTASAA